MKTVLVVEDSEDLRELCMEVLRQEGYQVLGAENGRDALAIVSRKVPGLALVVLDLMMPVMDGETFLRILHEAYDALAPPVIVVSAVLSERGRPQAAGYVKKPVTASALVDAVRGCCGPP